MLVIVQRIKSRGGKCGYTMTMGILLDIFNLGIVELRKCNCI
jgi:hypothetical protein